MPADPRTLTPESCSARTARLRARLDELLTQAHAGKASWAAVEKARRALHAAEDGEKTQRAPQRLPKPPRRP